MARVCSACCTSAVAACEWLFQAVVEPMKRMLASSRAHVASHQAAPLWWSNKTRRRQVYAAAEPAKRTNGWLIVGLGNPGESYQNTRHNVGFEAIDALAAEHGLTWGRKLTHKALTAEGHIHEKKVVLCKPMTFMNVSGESVRPLAKKHGFEIDQVVVMYDDLDCELGAVRLKPKGGHGGHNGMRSIVQHFGGAKDFPRIRIGIGRPSGSQDVMSWVLGKFRKDEVEEKDLAVRDAVDAVSAICRLGLELALSGKR